MEISKILSNHKKPKQPIEFLSDNDVQVKEKDKVADTFNEYFTSIGEKLSITMYLIMELFMTAT
jgi:hypothetical protein